jgi:hypothetical protein
MIIKPSPILQQAVHNADVAARRLGGCVSKFAVTTSEKPVSQRDALRSVLFASASRTTMLARN